MIIVAIDPSGNHDSEKEGMGTTGIAIYKEGKVTLHEVKASDHKKTEQYWHEVLAAIFNAEPDHIVIEGYKLYNHAGMNAQTQSNSTLMTSQLIGAIKLDAYLEEIPVHVQYASDVKTRWSDEVLQAKGILEAGNKFKGAQTNAHKRDALRHLCHFKKYKLEKVEK